mmetsp:Transcript_76427/g.181800  ORF Transcript_76427/g.181800 Transcript_76427/m.181800 type:complete len:226 (+) Transcript_76427:209-886(+)|eukprot:CAMPEP_0178382798 /NCGR_PEP_ID=MMETSP0689_2-20121128/6675_1 /TAXON_ID=160604 /ORGANISM="Amphidinium massartii, Strain CS-259" /LENGTH=225 /DNA_ID=CAMNT_0020003005 /DNA_START=114 /DNA_END=791 /DNA_ORIENTATION=-
MAEQWLNDYQKAKRSAEQLAKTVSAHDFGVRKMEPRQAAVLRGNLAQLRQDVSQLQQVLMASSQNVQAYNVTRKELERRGDLLAQLSETVEEIQEAVRTGSRRPHLLGSGGEVAWRERRRSDQTGDDAAGPGLLTEQELLRQDDTLDVLSGTVRNLRAIGGEITNEIDLHCRLLGELEEQTDDTTLKIKNQRGQLRKLSEESSTCHLWACICILLAVLIFLLVVV